MIKLRSKRFCRSNSKGSGGGGGGGGGGGSPPSSTIGKETKWEVRPGGMLVQKRESEENPHQEEPMISIKVSTVSTSHHISLPPTSTFGELKVLLSILTKLEAQEQRLLFKGKEREDEEHLHMVGVRDKDKVLMLEDPAIKESKLLGSAPSRVIPAPFRTITV